MDSLENSTPKALLVRMGCLQVEANRTEMARARLAAELFQRFSADFEARRAADPHFTDTPLAEVVTEVQPVTGQSASRIRAEVAQVVLVDAELPWLADLLDVGGVDLFRVRPVTDALGEDLADHPAARARFSARMEAWFVRAGKVSPILLNKTHQQIRHHVHYVVTKVLANEVDDRFTRRHRQRGVTSYQTGDGMAALVIDHDQVSVTLAEKNLDLLARDARTGGDPRTLDQLRADLAIDLLTGRSVPDGSTGRDVGRWARPVVNVTVPIQTLMGLSDEPGRMGEQTLPASLVRHVAADPDSTWYRLLTDPDRGGVELSTRAYAPTPPTWREVVALQPTCFAPTCTRPATDCEVDHRVRWPQGETSTGNLAPACPRHHRSKHVTGSSLHKTEGKGGRVVLRYTTRAGLTHVVPPPEQPVSDDPAVGGLWEALAEIQPKAAELVDALEGLRAHRHIIEQTEHEAELLGQRDDPGWWDTPPPDPELSALLR